MAEKKGQELDNGQLLTRANQIVGAYTSRDDQIDRFIDMYELDIAKPESEKIIPFFSSLPNTAVNTIGDMLAGATLVKNVAPNTLKAEERERTEAIENALDALMYQIEDTTGQYTIRSAAILGALTNMIAFKVIDLRGNKDHAEGDLPILIEPLNGRYVYPVISKAKGPIMVVEKYNRTAADIYADFCDMDGASDAVLNLESDDPTKEYEYMEMWTATQRQYWVQSTPVFEEPLENEYGFVPYAIYLAYVNGLPEKKHEAMGFLYAMDKSKSWDMDNILKTLYATTVFAYTNQSWAVYSNERSAQSPINLQPYGVNYMKPGDKIEPIVRAPLPPDIGNFQNALDAQKDMETFNRVLTGGPPGTQMAGFAISLLSNANKQKIYALQEALQRALAKAYVLACKHVARSGGDLKLYGKATDAVLRAKDVKDGVRISVELRIQMPQDFAAIASLAPVLTGGEYPAMDMDTFLERYLGLADTERISKKRRIQFFERNFMQEFAQGEAERYGYAKKEPKVPSQAAPNPMQGIQREPIAEGDMIGRLNQIGLLGPNGQPPGGPPGPMGGIPGAGLLGGPMPGQPAPPGMQPPPPGLLGMM